MIVPPTKFPKSSLPAEALKGIPSHRPYNSKKIVGGGFRLDTKLHTSHARIPQNSQE